MAETLDPASCVRKRVLEIGSFDLRALAVILRAADECDGAYDGRRDDVRSFR